MIQEKKKHKKSKKKPSAMAQVHNRVNAGVMDGVVYGGMMEAAEPEDGLEPYGHVVNESSDVIPFLNIDLNDIDAYPFITFKKLDGSDTRTFVGAAGEQHNTMPAALLSNGDIKRSDFKSQWDIKRNEYKSGRIWFIKDRIVVSFYSYHRDDYSRMYNDILGCLIAIQDKMDVNFNPGEVMIDFWTFVRGHDDVFVPLRWLRNDNDVTIKYFPHMIQCLPVENGYYKLVTDDHQKHILDWKGNDMEELQEYTVYEENKKTMYITEEQMKQMKVLLENEGTNIKKARRYLEEKGYSPEKRQEILNAVRNDVPNSRLQQCKFLLGVTRLYFDGELNDGNSIFQLNKVLKYVASDAHVNEYDWNLNGEHLQTLVDRFSGVARGDLEKARESSNKRQLVANENYTIVSIDSAEEAAKYGDYTSWCVTHDPNMYDSYTNGGIGRFYFCLRKGFENEPMVAGENCPLDSYGLSMIAVSVTMEGEVNTITCRWNHDNGGNDNVMSVEQLENIIGRNFYKTFLPYTKDELGKKGIIFPEDVQGLLDAGTAPQVIFYNFRCYRPEHYGIYGCVPVALPMGLPQFDEDGDEDYENVPFKYNFLRSDKKLLSDIWYDHVSGFEGPGVSIVDRNKKSNMVDTHGNILFKDWYDEVYYTGGQAPDGKFIAKVELSTAEQDTTGKKQNLIYVETGELLFNDWYDNIDTYFGNDGLVHVKLNDMENLVDVNGKPFLKQWYYRVFHFNDGIAQVGFKANENVRDTTSKWNFVDKNGILLSNENFELTWGFKDGFAIVGKSVPNEDANYTINGRIPTEIVFNAIDRNGNLLLDSWLRGYKHFEHDIREYVEKYIREREHRKEYKIKQQQQTVSESSARGNIIEAKEYSFDYKKYIKSLIEFMREQHLRIDPLPEIELNPEEQDGIFVKTGYYSPEEKKVVVFTDQRHPKDVLRTVAHEFIHHMQNLQNPDKDWGTGGNLEDDRTLRGIEGEAFLLGNIIFREWTEKMKKTKELNESKKRKKQVKNDKGEVVPETCDKCGGKVVVQIHGEPVYVCKDCGKYFGTMPCTLNEIASEIVEPDDVDLSSFNIKKHLNPKFWDDGHLDTRIRLKLLDIADDFFSSLDVDWVEPVDVIITGSLANYNWNKKYSDIDLHVLVDYEDVDERVDFVREYFTMKKNEWNEKHKNLKIFGFPVEVYVQDANEPHASSGVYSIDKDKWLTEPDFEKLRSGKVDKKHVREMVSTYMNKIDCLIDIYKKHKDDEYEMKKVAKDASEIFDEIKKMRKDDLAKYGREMCDGNIIFKALRRSDYVGKLIKLKNLTYDKINSL